jgi:hypothetical protein
MAEDQENVPGLYLLDEECIRESLMEHLRPSNSGYQKSRWSIARRRKALVEGSLSQVAGLSSKCRSTDYWTARFVHSS